MWFLWIVIGLLIGLGGAFAYYKVKLDPLYNAAIEGQNANASKLAKIYSLIESAHNAAWSPYGIREEMKDELWNNLWKFFGMDENGMPRG